METEHEYHIKILKFNSERIYCKLLPSVRVLTLTFSSIVRMSSSSRHQTYTTVAQAEMQEQQDEAVGT